ncbi:NlpC/P60 family protein [Streptomyces sp. NPDC055663]
MRSPPCLLYLSPGDLVFFKKSDSPQYAPVHVGLDIGHGVMLHCAPSDGVTVTGCVNSSVWRF